MRGRAIICGTSPPSPARLRTSSRCGGRLLSTPTGAPKSSRKANDRQRKPSLRPTRSFVEPLLEQCKLKGSNADMQGRAATAMHVLSVVQRITGEQVERSDHGGIYTPRYGSPCAM